MLTVGSLFSGIGGFDLGLERAGMRVIWQSETDPYASAVLKKHWPDVPNHGDIRGINWKSVWPRIPDVICGGFPCQPFSRAARGRNDAERCLWLEMLRVVSDVRPTWVCGENVAAIDGMALEFVVSDLEACGYEVAPPLVIPACAVGQDHRRDRYWFIGHANGDRKSWRAFNAEASGVQESGDDPDRMGAPHGISGGMDRNRMRVLGNAIVPQIAEIIGRAIVRAHT